MLPLLLPCAQELASCLVLCKWLWLGRLAAWVACPLSSLAHECWAPAPLPSRQTHLL
jgi:hypothetical protein